MTAQQFYEKEQGSHEFLSRRTIINLMEKYGEHVRKEAKENDKNGWRTEATPEKLSVHLGV